MYIKSAVRASAQLFRMYLPSLPGPKSWSRTHHVGLRAGCLMASEIPEAQKGNKTQHRSKPPSGRTSNRSVATTEYYREFRGLTVGKNVAQEHLCTLQVQNGNIGTARKGIALREQYKHHKLQTLVDSSIIMPTSEHINGAHCPSNNQPRPEAVVLGRPPEGADYVRLPPLGAWSWSGPSFLPGTGRGFSVDDDFQAYPLSCESLPKP